MKEDNDAALVKQCLGGSHSAFASIVDKHQKTIFNVALRMTNDCQEAEDITQSVFVKAFEKLATFDPNYKLFSWLYSMVVNESLNFLKRRKHFQELDESLVSPERTPEESYEQAEKSENIELALMHLEPEHRALIVLKHFQELSYKEISYILEIPEKTVKSRLFTARQLLRDILLRKGVVRNG